MSLTIKDSIHLTCIILAGLFILLNYIPYRPILDIPNDDYHNVTTVMTKLSNPANYPGNRLVDYLVKIHSEASLLYYHILSRPLYRYFHPSTTMKILGILACFSLFYLSGFQWNRSRNGVRALIILLVMLYSTSLFEGNRRSFRVVFLMGLLWSKNNNSFVQYLFFLALATGIYPPTGLVLLSYRFIDELLRYRRGQNSLKNGSIRIFWSSMIFVLILSPLLWSKIESQDGFSSIITQFKYNFSGFHDFFEFFIIGNRNSELLSSMPLLGVLGVICSIQLILIKKENLFLREEIFPLIMTVLSLWGLAHLFHPHLYQPNRYTKSAFLLVTTLFFTDNLVPLSNRVDKILPNRLILSASAGGVLTGTMVGYWSMIIRKNSFIGNYSWFGFGLGIIVFFSGIILTNHFSTNKEPLLYFSAILLIIFILFPRGVLTRTSNFRDSKYPGLYKKIQNTPIDSLVVGPPQWMDSILPFAKRNVYLTEELMEVPFVCDRIREFTKAYYSNTSDRIINYMKEKQIDYLLVDRYVFKTGLFSSCGIARDSFNNPILDKNFRKYLWKSESMIYLLSRKQLREQI